MAGTKRVLALFDVDGTLTRSRLPITAEMDSFLAELEKKVTIGLVGGSDLRKIAEQMSPDSNLDDKQRIDNLINRYSYVFSENGLIAYHNGQLIGKKSVLSELGEHRVQRFINFALGYLSKLTLPAKRGSFVEFRTGMINISPVGRSCSQEERLQFFQFDNQHHIREKMVQALREEFDNTDLNMQFAIGGQISIDCFPTGWDKTYCLQFVQSNFDQIHFFGDRTQPGGNDHELYCDPRVKGHSVTDPEHTKSLLTELFFWPKVQDLSKSKDIIYLRELPPIRNWYKQMLIMIKTCVIWWRNNLETVWSVGWKTKVADKFAS